ncbi:MAG: ATP-binding protein [Lachnospiraceae bacterium]|nr:ATP-binding protein [Lachnospiraceae bacterium]
MNVKDLIGETTEYEKKVALEIKKPKSWCKTISVFANGKGGKLIFGVDDNDNIEGLANMKKDSEDLSEIIKTHLNPIPKFDMSLKSIEGKDIIVVEVSAGEQTPYYYDGDGQLIAYFAREVFISVVKGVSNRRLA